MSLKQSLHDHRLTLIKHITNSLFSICNIKVSTIAVSGIIMSDPNMAEENGTSEPIEGLEEIPRGNEEEEEELTEVIHGCIFKFTKQPKAEYTQCVKTHQL